jgi:hypothetical protein
MQRAHSGASDEIGIFMGLDFPNSPTVGQLFPSPPTAGVPVWKWDGTEWVPVASGGSASPKILASGRFQINSGGSITIINSYNIASVVRTGVGAYTITFMTALADANYVILATAQGDASSNNCWIQVSYTPALPSTTIFYLAALQNAGATGDPRQVHFMCFE